MMFTPRFQIKSALIYFLIAAVFGVLLRMTSIIELPLEYRHVVHGHSHLALLGWVYLAMITLVSKLYLDNSELSKNYIWIVSLTHVTILGMMFTFPLQGYALLSIIFSSLFLVLSYWFIIHFVRNTPKTKRTFSFKVIRVSLLLMVLSSIGPWSLGAIVSTLGSDSVWYKMAIYFYLHFLYNGAFILFLVGLLFRVIEDSKIELSSSYKQRILGLFLVGLFLSFLLSVLYSDVPVLVNVLSVIGAFLQLAFFILLIKLVSNQWNKLKVFHSKLNKSILYVLAGFILLKCVLQMLTAFPYFVYITLDIYDFIIAYLHLVFLGIISLALLFFIRFYDLIRVSKTVFTIFFGGVLFSEALLIYRGLCNWLEFTCIKQFDVLVIMASALIPLSLIILILQRSKRNFE